MGPQSRMSLNFGNFGILILESRDKMHLDVGLMERHRVYYKGEGGGFSQSPGHGESEFAHDSS
jgi:hypothetical protein